MASKKTTAPKGHGDIQQLFSKAKTNTITDTSKANIIKDNKDNKDNKDITTLKTDTLISSDPKIQAFYDSLTASERIAHSIAITSLGTSYDVVRTHGYIRWSVGK